MLTRFCRLFIAPLLISAFTLASCSRLDASAPAKPPFTLAKETTVIIAPLAPDGTPDYLAALNATCSQGVTPENNGFVLWLEAAGDGILVDATEPDLYPPPAKVLQLCGAKPTPPGAVVLQAFSDFLAPRDPKRRSIEVGLPDVLHARHELWTSDQHPQLAAFLNKQAKPLDIVVQAAACPHWWSPYVAASGRERDQAWIGSPPVMMLREAVDDLCARATLCAKAGDFDGFLRDAIAAKQLARHIASGGMFIDLPISIGLETSANDALGAVIGSGTLTEAQCAALAKALLALGSPPPVAHYVDLGCRFQALNYVVLFATGKKEMLGAEFLQMTFSAIDRDAVDWDVALKYVNGVYDQFAAATKNPGLTDMIKQTKAVKDQIDKQLTTDFDGRSMFGAIASFKKRAAETRPAYSERVTRGLMAFTFLPALDGPAERHRQLLLQNDMLAALLAAAQARAQTGRWPDALDPLVPANIPQIPLDPYSPDEKTPVHYALTDGHARIYSVGRNTKDDGALSDDITIGTPAPTPPAKL